MENYENLKQQKDALVRKEQEKIIGLTKEMKNCIRLYFTFDTDGFELGCRYCPVNRENRVIRDNGVCTIFIQCGEWIRNLCKE